MAMSVAVAASDEGVVAVSTEVAGSPAEPDTTSVARAERVASASRCSMLRVMPNPLTVCVDVATRAAVPKAE